MWCASTFVEHVSSVQNHSNYTVDATLLNILFTNELNILAVSSLATVVKLFDLSPFKVNKVVKYLLIEISEMVDYVISKSSWMLMFGKKQFRVFNNTKKVISYC